MDGFYGIQIIPSINTTINTTINKRDRWLFFLLIALISTYIRTNNSHWTKVPWHQGKFNMVHHLTNG